MTLPAEKDPRSISELIAAALIGDEDDEQAWTAIRTLQQRGDQPVFAAAVALLKSPSAKERGRGVDILAQLGTPNPSHELRAQCAGAILGVLPGEQDSGVLSSIGVALGHLRDPRAVAALVPLKDHQDSGVRFGVVMGLSPHADPVAIAALIQLSGDADDEDVRNWATFALGNLKRVSLRLAFAAVLAGAATLLCSACGASGGCYGQTTSPCKQYVACFEATGGVKGALDSTYGAMGTCWTTTTAAAQACCNSCGSALEDLRRAYPDAGCQPAPH